MSAGANALARAVALAEAARQLQAAPGGRNPSPPEGTCEECGAAPGEACRTIEITDERAAPAAPGESHGA